MTTPIWGRLADLFSVRQRVPALAILASLAVGMAMFGGAVFLGQYFQVARGYSPTETGLLITRSGRIKPYVIAGAGVLVLGNLVLGFMDHDTPLWILWAGMLLMGMGVGLTMQNLMLGVQNTVSLRELGAASGAPRTSPRPASRPGDRPVATSI